MKSHGVQFLWIFVSMLTLNWSIAQGQAPTRSEQRIQPKQESEPSHIKWQKSSEVKRKEIEFDFSQRPQTGEESGIQFSKQGIEISPLAAQGFFISRQTEVPIESPEPVLAIGSMWTADVSEGAKVTLSLRASADGNGWSEWQVINVDKHVSVSRNKVFGNLLIIDKETKHIQYRFDLERSALNETVRVANFKLVYISPGATPKDVLEKIKQNYKPNEERLFETQLQFPKPPVVSRSGWGCPDGQASPKWQPQYTTVTHLIIHHTDTPNTASDWPAIVKAIWDYHTNTFEWGDIGYNYLIDPEGVIYEGRAGGDNVIGAHFICANSNTMGVAMIGSYIEVSPTLEAYTSLNYILTWKCDQSRIDPAGSLYHPSTQLTLNTISGHRDGNPSTAAWACPGTTCPGDNLYAQLESIRNDVKQIQGGLFSDVSSSDWSRKWIEEAYVLGIMSACGSSPLRFCPERLVTRAKTAQYLLRSIFGSDYSPPVTWPEHIFEDAIGHPLEIWIEDIYQKKLTAGCATNPLRFCPDKPATRAEMAVFLLRGLFGSNYSPTDFPNQEPIFADMEGHWAILWAEALYRKGLTAGCATNPLRFCPEDSVNRAQMAVFMVKISRGYSGMPVSVEEHEKSPSTPEQFSLHQNYPNPFNPNTTIGYELSKPAKVELLIHNLLGQTVRTLVNTEHPEGLFEIQWDGRDDAGQPLPSGLYLYRLQIPALIQTKKLLLLR